MSARKNFISKIDIYSKTLESPDLVSTVLTDIEHNGKAQMLRNGLAIIGFTLLEDFIKNRTGEIFKRIGDSGVQFQNLPESIREASIWNALNSVQYKASLLKKNRENYLSFIQQQTKSISSTLDINYVLSEYSLGWDKPNLISEDVKNFLGVMCVQGGWQTIQNIINKAGLTLIQSDIFFKNAMQRRHSAAHDPQADSLLTDLKGYSDQVKILGLAYDALVTKSLSFLLDGNANFRITEADITFRRISFERSVWKEFPPNSIKAYRVNSDLDKLVSKAVTTTKRQSQVLIVTRNNKLLNWYI